jgi:hypothetical protein
VHSEEQLSEEIHCPSRLRFYVWTGIFFAVWGLTLTVLRNFYPILDWPWVVFTVIVIIETLLMTFLVYDIRKAGFVESNPVVLDAVRRRISKYREKMNLEAQTYSRTSILAAFPSECHDFVEYALDHE